VRDEIGLPAVNLEPRQRFEKHAAVNEGALRARARGEIAKPTLETRDLPEPLDVAARQRQSAEARQRRMTPGRLTLGRGWRLARRMQRDAEWQEQAAEQNGIAQRVWSRFESSAIRVERGERAP